MSIRIESHTMSSTQTIHMATRIVDEATPFVDAEHWRVTWLPGRVLSRNEAITAMNLAEAIATMQQDGDVGDRLWPHVENWARELGLTGPDLNAEGVCHYEDLATAAIRAVRGAS